MITKKQWITFCSDIQKAKSLGMEPFLHGRRIIKVDLYNHRIITSIHGDLNRYVYDFDNSVNDVKSENLLRMSVKLSANLLNVKLWT